MVKHLALMRLQQKEMLEGMKEEHRVLICTIGGPGNNSFKWGVSWEEQLGKEYGSYLQMGVYSESTSVYL